VFQRQDAGERYSEIQFPVVFIQHINTKLPILVAHLSTLHVCCNQFLVPCTEHKGPACCMSSNVTECYVMLFYFMLCYIMCGFGFSCAAYVGEWNCLTN
jgi:hypothetical protein